MKFKSDHVKERTQLLNIIFIPILLDMELFCIKHKVELVITESVTTALEDVNLNRTSTSHREGRAVDIRTRDWSEDFTFLFVKEFSEKYKTIGAISANTGNRSFVVDKSKTKFPHLHLQISKAFNEK